MPALRRLGPLRCLCQRRVHRGSKAHRGKTLSGARGAGRGSGAGQGGGAQAQEESQQRSNLAAPKLSWPWLGLSGICLCKKPMDCCASARAICVLCCLLSPSFFIHAPRVCFGVGWSFVCTSCRSVVPVSLVLSHACRTAACMGSSSVRPSVRCHGRSRSVTNLTNVCMNDSTFILHCCVGTGRGLACVFCILIHTFTSGRERGRK